jgi:hypothetical protein
MPLWLGSRAKISTGAVFRGIDRWGRLASTALSPQAVNLILKKRARLAGLDAIELSAHGLQSGYLSETVRRGIPLVEAMQQSQHRSVQHAASDDNEVERQRGRAAQVISRAIWKTAPSEYSCPDPIRQALSRKNGLGPMLWLALGGSGGRQRRFMTGPRPALTRS